MAPAGPTATRPRSAPAGPGRRPAPRPPSGPAAVSVPRRDWPGRLESPLTSYYLLVGATLALIVLGLVMVLSSSNVEAYKVDGSSYAVFAKQAMFAVIGVPLMVVASRVPLRAWKRLAWPLVFLALIGQGLVLSPLGWGVNGNRNWFSIGPLSLQPAEGVKFALVVWGAAVLSRKRDLLHVTSHALIPVVPVAGVFLLLILSGHDLGSSLIIIALVGSVIFVAGAPLRVFAPLLAIAVPAVLYLVTASDNRMGRILSWVGGDCAEQASYEGPCWQSVHGKWALASGGWWGVGLGGSREKWSWLPEAHNDFIFAIIGEELGLIGTLAVLAVFALLGLGLFRVVVRSDDLFVKIATGGVLTWVLGQALINIGTVIGLLPVVGVPLPLVSSGGSALVMTMVALGMVIGFARQEAGARESLTARAGLVRRSLAVLPARGAGR